MNAPITPVRYAGPDISDWPGSPLSTLHGGTEETLPIRVEEFPRDDRYVIRFDLPGIDPAKDLDVSVEGQVLTVHAERRPDPAACHSQFVYGSFCGHVTLPAGTDDRDITATYSCGVLEVSVGHAARPAARKITISAAGEES